MTSFTRSCHGPNGRFTLSCAASVFGTHLMPYFVNSTSLVSKSVIRRYNKVNFKVKVNLGQSSCYFDLRSNSKLDLPSSKSICFDASGREKHDSALIIPLSFLVRSYLRKTVNPRIAIFFLWPDLEGLRYDLKRSLWVPLDSENPKDSFGLYLTVLSQLGVKWHGGLHPPMCALGWGNSMCGRGLRRPGPNNCPAMGCNWMNRRRTSYFINSTVSAQSLPDVSIKTHVFWNFNLRYLLP